MPGNVAVETLVGHDPLGGSEPLAASKLWTASPICLRLLAHLVRAAASRTFCTAGRSRPIRIAMIAMTTNSSIRVNAGRQLDRDVMVAVLREYARGALDRNSLRPTVTRFFSCSTAYPSAPP